MINFILKYSQSLSNNKINVKLVLFLNLFMLILQLFFSIFKSHLMIKVFEIKYSLFFYMPKVNFSFLMNFFQEHLKVFFLL
jgi:hypothetical protein